MATPVQFTLEDRERIIRLEEGQKALQRQVEDIKNFLYWGFGILFGGMGILIGFVMWDRRTALEPAMKKSRELEEREEKVERVLRELARKMPEVKEAMQKEGLL